MDTIRTQIRLIYVLDPVRDNRVDNDQQVELENKSLLFLGICSGVPIVPSCLPIRPLLVKLW